MSWFPAEVCRGSGTRGAQARGRGLQGDDVIHGQDQGGGGFATPSPRAPRIRSQPPRGALGARTGASLVTALGLRARRSRRTRPAPRRAGRKGHGAPGAEGSGSRRVLESPAHTHPGSPARARDVTRGRGADLLFGTQTLPIRGRGQRGRGGGGGSSHRGIGLSAQPPALSASPGRASLGWPGCVECRRRREECTGDGGCRGRGQWAGAGLCGGSGRSKMLATDLLRVQCADSSALPSYHRLSSPRCREASVGGQGCTATH